MENKIVEANTTEVMSDLDLHEKQIINQMNIAVQTIFEIGKLLKIIRDGKEYTARGFKSFKDYADNDTEKPFKFGYTQANKYIQVYERYSPIQEQVKNVQLDVLYELRFIPNEELEQINGLETMNADEAKQLHKQLEEAKEQISILQSTANNSEEVENLKAEIERLKSEPVNTKAEDAKKEIAKVKKELKAKAEAEKDKAVREAIDKERKAIAKEKDKAVKEATANLNNQLKTYEKKFEEMQENTSEFVQKIAKLEDKIKGSNSSSKFEAVFDLFNEILVNCFDALADVEDETEQKRFAGKLLELAENIIETAKGY